MDPGDAFSAANIFKWDAPPPIPPAAATAERPRELEEVFEGFGVRYATVERMGELGFTASTLAGMREDEVDDMIAALSHLFRWDLLVGERYGIKAALRAERRRIDAAIHLHDQYHAHPSSSVAHQNQRRLLLLAQDPQPVDAQSQEGLSEEHAQLEGSGGSSKGRHRGGGRQRASSSSARTSKKKKKSVVAEPEEDCGSDSEEESEGGGAERQREHPFIVTEPGEVARAKKNGLDYLFHLYDQCGDFLLQVQALARERGDKCPTKVTNQVFRFAKRAGAGYINKPKMRHYVHCYALHCVDERVSNALRKEFKARGENVGAWRHACYSPLVSLAASHYAFDIDALFNAHPRLAIWYVPTRLRHLCHLARTTIPPNIP